MIENKKQALLIMCHNDFYILEKSLELLDNPKIDFYIHVDAKTKDFDYDKINSIVKKSKIFYTDRINTVWGTYSLIEVELLLIKEALKNGDYSYLCNGSRLCGNWYYGTQDDTAVRLLHFQYKSKDEWMNKCRYGIDAGVKSRNHYNKNNEYIWKEMI